MSIREKLLLLRMAGVSLLRRKTFNMRATFERRLSQRT